MTSSHDSTVSRVDPPPHAQTSDEVAGRLHSEVQHGLTTTDVSARREQYGFNELVTAPPTPMWRRLAAQFQSLVIAILIVAAVIAGALGEWTDTLAIVAIVLLNGLLGFFQEERAEQALAALRSLSSPMAKVLRDGQLQTLAARELVPGDRIELEAGDNIPADARLLTAFSLRVQEAALTGESAPTEKDAAAVLEDTTALGDRRNMVFLGTVIAAGKASALVVATGMRSELGQIAGLLQSAERELTPLQRRLEELGRTLVVVCLGIVAVIFTLQMLRGGNWLEVLLMSVSLAVAAVPEGLPAVVTVALALGLQRMVKRNALVRKLPSVETLGTVTVICTDKTGTLTRNEMTVRELWTATGSWSVTGTGYAPHGNFNSKREGQPLDQSHPPTDVDLRSVLTIGAFCNNARVVPHPAQPMTWQVIGDPTEGALIVVALKAGIDAATARGHLLFELPFDSDRKMMSVVLRDGEANRLLTKGAAEVVLGRCVAILDQGQPRPITDVDRERIVAANQQMASQALRVLAVAQRTDVEKGTGPIGRNGPEGVAHKTERSPFPPLHEESLVFAGLIGMIDPPRDEVRDAVQRCHAAGIRPVMITGDHPHTALAIARELHIADAGSTVVTGHALNAMTDAQLSDEVDQIAVFARVTAEHKLRVVRAWQSRGQIVAMTGDGVNDAPAVKAADIGIVMGVTGTDVAKEAADMVLTDDNFTSIVNAVEEGRGIFDNIQKFLHFLLSSNASEVLVMFVAAVLGWPVPFIPIQLLWINLVTDSLPALALALEPPETDIMLRQPRPAREAVITWSHGLRILWHGGLLASASLIAFFVTWRGVEEQLPLARTVAFSVLTMAQVFYSLGCRSQRFTMPQLGLLTNPAIFAAMAISTLLQLSILALPIAHPIFGIVSMQASHWLLVMGLALAPVTIVEVAKLVAAASGMGFQPVRSRKN